MGELRTGKTDRRQAMAYMDKANDFYNGMVDASQRGNWTVTASNAVHCVINSCDAVTVKILGERSISLRHDDVIRLLAKARPSGIGDKIHQIQEILSAKSKVEYGFEKPSKGQAEMMAKQAHRVFAWAKEIVRE